MNNEDTQLEIVGLVVKGFNRTNIDGITAMLNSDGKLEIKGVTDGNTVITFEDIKKVIERDATTGFEFATYSNFINWLSGAYNRNDGKTPKDLKLGDEIWLKETGVPDYWYSDNITKPITINNFSKIESEKQPLNYVIVETEELFNSLEPFDGLKVYIKQTQKELIYKNNKWEENNIFTNAAKEKVNVIINSEDGTKFLSNDGRYLPLPKEEDPTVPQHIKQITEENIRSWNNKAEISQIPTSTIQLTNDSGFITMKDLPDVPIRTSELINDSGFTTTIEMETYVNSVVENAIGNVSAILGNTDDLEV